MRTLSARLLPVFVLLTLGLTGCGEGGDDEPGRAMEPAGSPPSASGSPDWFPQQFAATLEHEDAENPESAGSMRFYVGDRRIRLEPQQGGTASAMILIHEDDERTRVIHLMPATRQYMEMVSSADDDNVFDWDTWMLSPDDPRHPCQTDDAARCERLGTETILGRQTQQWRYRFADEDGEVEEGRIWYDPEIHYPIRIEEVDGTRMEITDLDVGRQPADLFEVPEGYEKMVLPT